MGTKLRSISTSMAAKVIAFILVVISITAAVVEIQYLTYSNLRLESIFVKEYKDSEDFLLNTVYMTIGRPIGILNGVEPGEQKNFYYYVTDGKKTASNVDSKDKNFFEQHDKAFFGFEKGAEVVGKNTRPLSNSRNSYNMGKEYTVYIAFTDEFMAQKQLQWQSSRTKFMPIVINTAACIGLALLLLVYLICVTGKMPEDRELHLSSLDSIYSDILVLAFIIAGTIFANFLVNPPYRLSYTEGRVDINQIYSLIRLGAIVAAASAAHLIIILSLVRKIKAGRLLKHTLIFIAAYKAYDLIKSLFDGRRFKKYPLTRSLFYRQAIFISTSAILILLTILFLAASHALYVLRPFFLTLPIIEVAMVYWYIEGNNKTFADINKGFNESLEEQMKAERMKIALVTNVSHDLKTPLTSIISYVDLLSNEEGLSETASDYVKILAEKSNRLKNIVADLFDLAKSTSGDIALDLEALDLKKLIEQTLGDMEDEIEKSGLQIKTNLAENPVNIVADGKKLYRVFQNVIGNALKYALKDTRIFVNLEEAGGKAVVTIKNIAGYEMDFTAEEILQRFSRGDKARSTDGSGLGLSIAESFTKVCGGDFKVEVDGDLFKIIISFNHVS